MSSPREAPYDTLRPSTPATLKFPPGPLYPSPPRPQWLPIPGALRDPEPLDSALTPPAPLPGLPAARSQFRMSEMNTASPRIPSPLDTAGMMAVGWAPGAAGQAAAQRSGGRREGPQQRREPAGRGGGRAGGRAGRPQPRPRPRPSPRRLRSLPPIGCSGCRSDAGSPRRPLSLAAGQRHAAAIGPVPRYFRSGAGRRRCLRGGRSLGGTYCRTAPHTAGSGGDWLQTLSCPAEIVVTAGGGIGIEEAGLMLTQTNEQADRLLGRR